MIEINDDNFDELLEANKFLMVYFSAEWSGPCRMTKPAIETLSEKYTGKVKIGEFKIEESSDVAAMYGIKKLPTCLLFEDGDVSDRITGPQTQMNLEDWIEGNI